MVALNLAFKNIIRKQERSLLTIIGVILAVGCFVALLSVAEGLHQKLRKEIYGRNVHIYIMPSSATPLPTGPIGSIGFSTDSIDVIQPLPQEILVKKPTEEESKNQKRPKGNIIHFLSPGGEGKFPNIKKVIGITRFQQTVKGKTAIFWGLPYEQSNFTEENIIKTFFPTVVVKSGVMSMMDEAQQDTYCTGRRKTIAELSQEECRLIVGSKLAQELELSLDKPVSFKRGSEKIELIPQCIVEFKTGFQDYFFFMPISTAMTIEDSPGKVKEIWIQVDEPSKIKTTKRLLQINFPDLVIRTNEEYLGASGELVKYAWLLQFAIALIGILIATTASMNTMLMSTFERVKEFGALRAIGASRFTIVNMILIESLILSVTGGIIGILLGLLGSHFLDGAVMSLFQISFPLAKITINLVFYAFLLSIAIGIAGAVVPAVLIYRMGIIKSLKWN